MFFVWSIKYLDLNLPKSLCANQGCLQIEETVQPARILLSPSIGGRLIRPEDKGEHLSKITLTTKCFKIQSSRSNKSLANAAISLLKLELTQNCYQKSWL